MAGFIRRFTTFPPLAVITEIESVDIIDLIPPGIFVGLTTGTVALVGEWPGGPVNTPTLVQGSQTIENDFGGFAISMSDPLSFTPGSGFSNPFSNGCAFTWLKAKRYRRLVLCRPDLTLAEGVHLTIGGTPNPLTSDVTIPAGTRVLATGTNEEFALAYDVTFAAGVDNTSAGSQVFDPDREAAYTERTVSSVPVYSTKGQDETAVGDVDLVNATDLFNAGIGAGTGLPNITVAVTTAAIAADSVTANSSGLAALSSAAIDTAYENAIDALDPGSDVTDTIEVVAAARESATIRSKLQSHVANASQIGRGRMALVRPPIGTDIATATSSSSPGVGATRADRVIYCYPHFEQTINDITALDPNETVSNNKPLIGADAAMSTLLSQLPPEENPGQSTQDLISGGLLQFINKLEPGLVTAGQPTRFTLANYITFKANGIAALRRDSDLSEWVFQSGVTSVDPTSFPSLVNIKRRRMADFLQDSMSRLLKRFNKKLRTEDREDTILGELTTFLDLLLSENNPPAQRINDYELDAESGNTEELAGAGVFVVITNVRLLNSLDNIVLQTNIGESVTIQEAAA